MKQIETYVHNGETFKVVITRKRMRTIRYRLIDDTFRISAPRLATMDSIKKGLDKFADKLIKARKPQGIGEDYVYILGYRYPFMNSGEIRLINGQKLKFSSKEDYEKKIKKAFLEIVVNRVRYYENRMALAPHNVKVRNMSSRYGSNSKRTRSVNFALKLYHYSIDILDAIVVHELAHSIEFNHSKAFYSIVYKYCPNYELLHRKLEKGVFL